MRRGRNEFSARDKRDSYDYRNASQFSEVAGTKILFSIYRVNYHKSCTALADIKMGEMFIFCQYQPFLAMDNENGESGKIYFLPGGIWYARLVVRLASGLIAGYLTGRPLEFEEGRIIRAVAEWYTQGLVS